MDHIHTRLPRDVLWVDDEVSSSDNSVRLLGCEGFRVDCATSFVGGLTMARACAYDGIILDVRLPDGSGLTLLETLRAEGIGTPVLVLTGYAALETAVAAMKLGAADVREKPLFGDELIGALTAVVGHTPPVPVAAGYPVAEDAEMLLYDLALANVDVLQFIEAASAIRQALAAAVSLVLLPALLRVEGISALARARGIITRTAIDRAPVLSAKVRAVIAQIQTMASRRPSEQEVADSQAIDRAHMGRRLHKETGVSFRACRSAAAVQVAARWLAASDLPVKHISTEVGFAHPSQLDREFGRLLGMSPRAFRQPCAKAAQRRADGTVVGSKFAAPRQAIELLSQRTPC